MEFCKLLILFHSFFIQAGEFSRFYWINGLCYVQEFLRVTPFFSSDDKSPIVAGFWHFVSLLVLERSSYARNQLRPSFGTLCLPLFDLRDLERWVGEGHLRGELRFHAEKEDTALDFSEAFGGLFRLASWSMLRANSCRLHYRKVTAKVSYYGVKPQFLSVFVVWKTKTIYHFASILPLVLLLTRKTQQFVGSLEMIISFVRRWDILQPQSKIIVYRMDKFRWISVDKT